MGTMKWSESFENEYNNIGIRESTSNVLKTRKFVTDESVYKICVYDYKMTSKNIKRFRIRAYDYSFNFVELIIEFTIIDSINLNVSVLYEINQQMRVHFLPNYSSFSSPN